MDPAWLLSLRDGFSMESVDANEVAIFSAYTRVTFRLPFVGAFEVLRHLNGPGQTVASLLETAKGLGGTTASASLGSLLRRLTCRGFLVVAVRGQGQRLASLVALTPAFAFASTAPARPQVLSRFAFLRRLGNDLVLESPLSLARVALHDSRAVALIQRLMDRKSLIRESGLVGEAKTQVMGLLASAGMLTEANADGTTAEDDVPALQSWDFHDLLFHSRSREGRTDAPFGGTYPHAERLPSPPMCKPVDAATCIDLDRPDLAAPMRDDPPFASVLEGRRSIREYAADPIRLSQLSELLFRCVRIQSSEEIECETWAGPVRMELAFRPCPAGGALHELEVYPVVQQCSGLDAGLYRYDPKGHRLERVTGTSDEWSSLLERASQSAGIPREKLQVMLVIASRFQRLAWKYSSMAYALTLKNVGVLYQTLYLAATAMGLAPCALGGGDADLFARAIGGDYCVESSVGEFLIGSSPRSRG